MHVKAASPSPNWQQAFGPEAEVCFHAWAVARYVGQVAAAGKAVYPLPMYVNAALRNPLHPGGPGTYESGGPTDNVLPIWKVAAPALDMLAPDDYEDDPAGYLKVLEIYHRDDNPLFVPETGGASNARFFFSALGLQTIGFSPYGMDFTRSAAYRWTIQGRGSKPRENAPDSAKEQEDYLALMTPWAMNYRLIGPMQREIARFNFEGKLQAVAEEKGKVMQTMRFGAWNAVVSYGASRHYPPIGNSEPTGRALVAQLNDNQFLVAGYFCRVDFEPADSARQRQFLRVEEGIYENGVFKFLRVRNGDDTDYGLNLNGEPLALRVSLATY
jgi:hypothetical protein